MSYTDKELQLATQIAYMKISGDDIDQYYVDHGEYPSIQWLLTNSDKTVQNIVDEYMAIYDASADSDSIAGIRRDSAQKIIDDIIAGTSECSSWKIVSANDNNTTSGMYGCLIETSANEAIVGFRGSESYDDQQFYLDWLVADFGLMDSTQTQQQADAEAFINQISSLDKQYDSYVLTGHSLGGNLATHAAITANESIVNKIEQCYSFDGPGFSLEYINEHKADITEMASKITHYQWSPIGALLNQ